MTIETQYGFKGLEMQSAPAFFHGLENQYGFKGVEMQTVPVFAKPLEKVFGFKGVEIMIDYKGRAGKTVKKSKLSNKIKNDNI